MVVHPIAPVYDENSSILILGSFPSVRSREEGFFYGHPKNRFWRVISKVCGEDAPLTVEEKKAFLLRNGIAVWDVIRSCEIEGSADSTIRNAVPNDLSEILKRSKVRRIFVNGKKAESMYVKYSEKQTGIRAVVLPSTSPANAAWSEDRLFRSWYSAIKDKGDSNEEKL